MKNTDTFAKLQNIFEKNKDNNPNKWLSLKSFFPRLGKQGVVGVFNVLEDEETTSHEDAHPIRRCFATTSLVFKYSQYINYLIQHEYCIGEDLNNLAYSDHFVKTIGAINIPINPKINHKVIKRAQKTNSYVNPFDVSNCKYPIYKEVLLQEEIKNGQKFSHYIKKKLLSQEQLYGIINQMLFAIKIGQTRQFTHYDLHSDNIIVKPCNSKQINIYKFGNKAYLVPTHGFTPIIIDFGFSYSNALNSGYCWPSMGHTHAGFISDRFDPISDMKLFLLTVSSEIKDANTNENSLKLRNICKNIFAHLKVDNYNGWDDYLDISASDSVLDLFSNVEHESSLFDRFNYHIIDLVTSLTILPYEEEKTKDVVPAFVAFISEYAKIEKELDNDFYSLYVLKDVIQSVRNVRHLYIKQKTREQAIHNFRTDCFEAVNTVSKYCTLKNVKWEKMLCGIICLSKNVEGLIHIYMEKLMAKKVKHLEKMRISKPEEVWECINFHIPDSVNVNIDKDSTFILIDIENTSRKEIKLNKKQIEELNRTHWSEKGNYIVNL
jgi:hypothetical protein